MTGLRGSGNGNDAADGRVATSSEASPTGSVAGLRDAQPELPVESRLVRGRAATTLIDLSAKAQLVVVGSRGRGGFLGLLLGSTGQALIHHADCSVAVVHPHPVDTAGSDQQPAQ